MPKISSLPIATSAGTGDLLVLDQGLITKRIDFANLQSSIMTAGAIAAIVNFIQSGAGAVTRTVQNKLQDAVNGKDFGIVGDGIVDDTAALNAAILACPAGQDLVLTGTILISSQITISKDIHFVFTGKLNIQGGPQYPSGTYLLKKSTMTTPAVLVTGFGGNGFRWTGGGIVGQVGNTGNGINVESAGVVIELATVARCGQDGIRVGSDNAGTSGGLKCDLIGVTSQFNGRHGIFYHDPVTLNANGGTLAAIWVSDNTGDGLKFGNATANTVDGGFSGPNTGIGVHFAAGAVRNAVLPGFDLFENNVGGKLVYDVSSINNMVWGADTYTDNGSGNYTFQIATGQWTGPIELLTDFNPPLSLRSVSIGHAVYQHWKNSAGARMGFFGFAANFTSDLTLMNEQPGSLLLGSKSVNGIAITGSNAVFQGTIKPAIVSGYHSNDDSAGMTSNLNIGAKVLVIKDGIVTGFA